MKRSTALLALLASALAPSTASALQVPAGVGQPVGPTLSFATEPWGVGRVPHNNEIEYCPLGDRYFSVFSQKTGGVNNSAHSPEHDIYGVFIDASNGAVLNSPALPLVVGGEDDGMPCVSWNPSTNRFLLVFARLASLHPLPPYWEIYGLVLEADGAAEAGASPFLIGSGMGAVTAIGEPCGDMRPKISCDGANWLVVWIRNNGYPEAAVGRFVNGASTNTGPAFTTDIFTIYTIRIDPLRPSATGGAWPIDIAYNSGTTSFLATWRDWDYNRILGRIVNPDGSMGALKYDAMGALDYEAMSYDAPSLTQTPYLYRHGPAVAANAANREFLVAWSEQDVLSNTGAALIARVDANGDLIAGSRVAIGSPDPLVHRTQVVPVWNSGANQYFVGWLDSAGTPDPKTYEVRGAQLRGADASVIQDDIRIAQPGATDGSRAYAYIPFTAAVSREGSAEVVFQWRVMGSAPPFPVQAQRFGFTLPPDEPVGLAQSQDGLSFPAGDGPGLVCIDQPRTMHFFAARLSDPEGQDVHLEIEYTLTSASFSNAPTVSGAPVTSGSAAVALADPSSGLGRLRNGEYKWQARAVDSDGGASYWVPFDPGPAFDFKFDIANQLPQSPTSLEQRRFASTTIIPPGGSTDQGLVVLRALLDPDPDFDLVRLEVEVQFDGTPFTGVASVTSAYGAPGIHEVTFRPLVPGRSYVWQAWIRDDSWTTTDTTGPALISDLAPHITRSGNNAPMAARALGQYSTLGMMVLLEGGELADGSVTLEGIADDPDFDDCMIEVVLTPAGEGPANLVTGSGSMTLRGATFTITVSPAALAATGATHQTSISGLNPGGYTWRARATDAYGLSSTFADFGAGGATDPDFIVPDAMLGGSYGTQGCVGGGSASGALVPPVLLAAMAVMVAAIRSKIA